MRVAHQALRAAVLLCGTASLGAPLPEASKIAGLQLERSTFNDAIAALGPAESRDNGGDAGAHAVASCYIGRDRTALVLLSNGEMGGGKVLTEFQLLRSITAATYTNDERYVVPQRNRPRCGRSQRISAGLRVAGIHLGMKRRDIVGILGDGSQKDRGSLTYSEDVSVGDGGFVTYRTVTVEFMSDKAIAIRVVQVTSN